MNILVTGGAGYIGSHCCKELSKKGFQPVAIDNLVYGHENFVKWGDFFQGDVGDAARLKKCLAQYKIDAVMHLKPFLSPVISMPLCTLRLMPMWENRLKIP